MASKSKKKLIEVALPLEAINIASAREKSIRHGHPSTLHLWWARRPLAAARAVIFAQMVDDPSSLPDLFPTEKKQEKERQRLFKIIEELVKWENTTNEEVLEKARNEIWLSWRRACSENVDHPKALDIFDRKQLPPFHDPFAGGGALPLEAQRLGLESYATDLNPVAVLINKAMIEIPPRFSGKPPVNATSRNDKELFKRKWKGAQGLADDIKHYGRWMREEAEKRIGHLYPKIEVTAEMASERRDLKPLIGKRLTVLAWIWARTVKSPNPAFSNIDVPLASTFMLSTKPGKEAYIHPLVTEGAYRFEVKMGRPKHPQKIQSGTSAGKRKAFSCLVSGVPIPYEYIRAEGMSGRMGTRLMAVVAESELGRIYLPPSDDMEAAARKAQPIWQPNCEMPKKHRNFQPPVYGMNNLGDIFTKRQLVALTTLADLVQEVREQIINDSLEAGMANDGKTLEQDGLGATGYADSIACYLGLAVSRTANTLNALVVWSQSREQSVNLFSRQAIPMGWDFPEVNPFGGAAGDFGATTTAIAKTIATALGGHANISQADAQTQNISFGKVVSTDPPYYDNVAYADLSDFFYVWLRRALKPVFPNLLATLAVPKVQELVAMPHRHGNKVKAEEFFLSGMTKAMHRLADQAHPAFPVTIYYAFKQSESKGAGGTASTGWETFLAAVIRAGFAITGTWPMRTERPTGVKSGMNALASSIILVCRPLAFGASVGTRRDFLNALKLALPLALTHLQRGNIAPVDLAQAAIGPGMAVYTRYSRVLDADGKPLSVRDALSLINQILDESLAEQEGDFDASTRWALAWFEQAGFEPGDYGVAEQLSKSKNTSVAGMVEARIVESKRGKVRLLRPEELPEDWDPADDNRLTHWETVHHLVRVISREGERGAGLLVSKLGSKAENARELCYRLYTICERKKRPVEALAYNSLVQSWPEILRIASEGIKSIDTQTSLFNREEVK